MTTSFLDLLIAESKSMSDGQLREFRDLMIAELPSWVHSVALQVKVKAAAEKLAVNQIQHPGAGEKDFTKGKTGVGVGRQEFWAKSALRRV